MSYGDPYDCSYMTTEYVREKIVESYNIEAKDKDWENMKQGIDDCCRWVSMELDNDMNKKRQRLSKCLAYFEEASGIIENELVNLPEEDWRDDR
jgi:hypothetical protein